MLDLFSGLGGASQAMTDRRWQVVRVDLDPGFCPDVVADIRDFRWGGAQPDLIWASPPCTEFAREFMPWSRTGRDPDLSLVEATIRIVEETKPRFWILENVRGAVRWLDPILGKPRAIIGPYFLWGFFPPLPSVYFRERIKKESLPSSAAAERAKIPYELSMAVAVACETQPVLLETL
jgi:site-specific DNA-cytosine methylase